MLPRTIGTLALSFMNLSKLPILVAATIAASGLVASLAIQHQAQMKLREKETLFRQHGNQLDKLAAEHQRLSNLLSAADRSATNTSTDDYTAELVKLRTEAETLRKQTNELAKKLVEHHRSPPLRYAARAKSGGPLGSRYLESESNSRS